MFFFPKPPEFFFHTSFGIKIGWLNLYFYLPSHTKSLHFRNPLAFKKLPSAKLYVFGWPENCFIYAVKNTGRCVTAWLSVICFGGNLKIRITTKKNISTLFHFATSYIEPQVSRYITQHRIVKCPVLFLLKI